MSLKYVRNMLIIKMNKFTNQCQLAKTIMTDEKNLKILIFICMFIRLLRKIDK